MNVLYIHIVIFIVLLSKSPESRFFKIEIWILCLFLRKYSKYFIKISKSRPFKIKIWIFCIFLSKYSKFFYQNHKIKTFQNRNMNILYIPIKIFIVLLLKSPKSFRFSFLIIKEFLWLRRNDDASTNLNIHT